MAQRSFRLTRQEYDYLLPVLKSNLLERGDFYYFLSNGCEELEDMLNRLKGLYDNYNDLGNMVVYRCSKFGSLNSFRESIGVTTVF